MHEWLAIEGNGYARHIAERRWLELGGLEPVPISAELAARRAAREIERAAAVLVYDHHGFDRVAEVWHSPPFEDAEREYYREVIDGLPPMDELERELAALPIPVLMPGRQKGERAETLGVGAARTIIRAHLGLLEPPPSWRAIADRLTTTVKPSALNLRASHVG